MAEIPNEMMTLQRQPDQTFLGDEALYRRFHPDHWEDGGVAAEAFRLPNMSVNRGKYGPIEWTILSEDDEFVAWGVARFLVEEIPYGEEMIHLGMIVYRFEPRHVPLRRNYPHSEVCVFRDNVHICADNKNTHILEPEFHLRWRERLSQLAHVAIQPTADA